MPDWHSRGILVVLWHFAALFLQGKFSRTMPLWRVESAKASSLALGTWGRSPPGTLCPLPPAKVMLNSDKRQRCLKLGTKSKWKLLTFAALCLISSSLRTSSSCRMWNVFSSDCGARVWWGEGRAGKETPCAGSTAASEAFLCQVCVYVLRDKDGKTLSGYVCPAWNTELVTGNDANTGWPTQERQFTVLQENKAEALKPFSFQHWCSSEIFAFGFLSVWIP